MPSAFVVRNDPDYDRINWFFSPFSTQIGAILHDAILLHPNNNISKGQIQLDTKHKIIIHNLVLLTTLILFRNRIYF